MAAMRASDFAPQVGAADSPGDEPSRSLRDRLVPPMPPASWWGWAGPLLVTAFGGFLRFYRLGAPHAVVFDETYYVPDAWSILRHGVEFNHPKNINALLVSGSTHILSAPGEYVAHPPLGKMMIAVGEWLFGLTPFGWRFAVAVVGTLAILMTARITRRMTRSTLLGCVAGLLMALDGLELVLSRTAILDIFVMFWMLAAFGMLVLDRDASRARMANIAAAGDADRSGGGPKLGLRWRRVLAGVFLGCACATKWNGIWFLFAFGGLAIAWDIGARRALGYRDRLGGVLRSDVKWLPVSFGVVPFLTYLASWSGWFASSQGYGRNWAAAAGNHTPDLVGARLLVPVPEVHARLRPRPARPQRLRVLSVDLDRPRQAGLHVLQLPAEQRVRILAILDRAGSARDRDPGDLVGVDPRAALLPGVVGQPPGLASRGRPRRRRGGLAAVVLVRLARPPDRVLLLRHRLPAVTWSWPSPCASG